MCTHLVGTLPPRLLFLCLVQLCPVHFIPFNIRCIIPLTARRLCRESSSITGFQTIIALLFRGRREINGRRRGDIERTPIWLRVFRIGLNI